MSFVSSLQSAMLDALRALSQNPLGTARSAPIDKFQHNPDGYDRDLVQQRDEDSNTTSTSVGAPALVVVSIYYFGEVWQVPVAPVSIVGV